MVCRILSSTIRALISRCSSKRGADGTFLFYHSAPDAPSFEGGDISPMGSGITQGIAFQRDTPSSEQTQPEVIRLGAEWEQQSMYDWVVYLSGEIHTDWRERIVAGAQQAELSILFTMPVTDHAASDDCGEAILGKEVDPFWRDHKAARINAIRTRKLIEEADLVVVRFGDKYRQWNAAFEAGMAVAMGKSLITLHAPELTHALKEVDAAALATADSPEQVIQVLKYINREN